MIIKNQFLYYKSIVMLIVIVIGLLRCDLTVVTTEPASYPYQTEHFIIYYDTNLLTTEQIENIGIERERLLDYVNGYLNTSYNRTIEIFISDTLVSSAADAGINERIRENTSYSFRDKGHEIAHIISMQEWGDPDINFLLEGVAQAASDYKGQSIIDIYQWDLSVLLSNHESDLTTEMNKLVDKLSSGEWNATAYEYDQAGAFIQFLKDTYGLQMVKRWYLESLRSGTSDAMNVTFYDVFGINSSQAVTIFKNVLSKN